MIPYLHRTGRKRKRSRKFKPGYDRTAGLYGRFRKRRKTNRTEQKFYDIDIAGPSNEPLTEAGFHPSQGGAGPSTTCETIIDIPQGTGESQRIGRKITIVAIHLRLIFVFDESEQTDMTAGLHTHDTIRVMIYLDKQCNGTTANATDILVTDHYLSFRNITNSSRFRIISDKIFDFNTSASAAGGNLDQVSVMAHKNKTLKLSYKLKIPIEYSGTTGNITEIRSNNIGILLWAANSDGRTIIANDSRARIRFTDK